MIMKKAYRIKKNEEFQQIFKKGKSFANRQLVIYHMKNKNQSYFRVGLSVGKRIGNAVTRNRIKRYLRESFRSLQHKIIPSIDITIIARQPTKNMNYHEIRKSLIHLLTREQLLKK